MSKTNTFIFISTNGSYHVVEATEYAVAYSRLEKKNTEIAANIKHTLEIPGSHSTIIDHETE